MELNEARDIVCKACLQLTRQGLVARTWGNISVRLDETRFVITPSGRSYETLSPDEIVVVRIEELTHEGKTKPSSEQGMHAEIYKSRPEITAVVHTHQLHASTVAAAHKEITGLSEAHTTRLGESVQCAAYALPGTRKLSQAACAALGPHRNAALLANHGAVCVGKTMEAAFQVAATLEEACEAFIADAFSRRYNKTGPTLSQMHDHYLETVV